MDTKGDIYELVESWEKWISAVGDDMIDREEFEDLTPEQRIEYLLACGYDG